MNLNDLNAGLEAEKLAATYLRNNGLKLLAQNYHCRFGEIDLVMTDEATLVFVEVRLRSSRFFGDAAASITPQKQHKIQLTAQHYLQQLNSLPACRFDVILMNKVDMKAVIWLKDAF